MIFTLIVNKSIEIKAPVDKVWDAITNPEIIKQYFFGTTVICDWKVGSPIIFQGEWEGKSYQDKGFILDFDPKKILSYNYWSSFSGLEDKLGNYSLVTYDIEEKDGNTIINLVQQGFVGEQALQHAEKGWEMVLNKLKDILEG